MPRAAMRVCCWADDKSAYIQPRGKQPMPDLHAPNLLILLSDVARLIRTQADRRARAHGMTRAQWMILVRLRRCGGMTQRELAEILEVEPITVGRLVDRLAARGLVERRADPADRRVWRLHLTPAGDPRVGANGHGG